MFQRIVRNSCYYSQLLPLGLFSSDQDKVEDTETARSISALKENETGKERLYKMFTTDEFGYISPELNSALQASYFGIFVGACYGGFINSRFAYMDFMERNEATAFRNHLDAKKKLQDKVTIGFGKGAWRWGWRLGLFTGSYILITTTIAVYRGRSSLMEYVAAGGITGAVFRCSMGLRASAVAGGLGCILGGLGGAATLGILHLSGMTMEDLRYYQHKWKEERDKQFFKGEGLSDPLFQHHIKNLEENKQTQETVPSTPSQDVK